MQGRHGTGGYAALAAAATFVFGFVMAATVLSDYTIGDPDPAESVAFLVDHQTALGIWYAVIYVGFGVALVPLVLTLRERLRNESPMLAEAGGVFGFIWAGLVIASGMIAIIGLGTVSDLYDVDPVQAEPVWSAIDSVQNGLGGGNEIVGGLWVLLISTAAMRAGSLPNALNYLGMVAGVAGIVTVLPALEDVGAVFGLGLIVWFVWVGFVLLRTGEPSTPPRADRASTRGAA